MQVEPVRIKVRKSDWSRSAVLGDRGAAARDFADIVAGQLVGTVLPWGQRESLVRTASQHGITRFEANLIIAAVQHQMGVGKVRGPAVRTGLLRQIAAGFAVFLTVQAGIIAVAWYWLS